MQKEHQSIDQPQRGIRFPRYLTDPLRHARSKCFADERLLLEPCSLAEHSNQANRIASASAVAGSADDNLRLGWRAKRDLRVHDPEISDAFAHGGPKA